MCGSDTLTTVVSSTSIKVLSITAMAMIQRLTCGCSDFSAIAIASSRYLRANFRGTARPSQPKNMVLSLLFCNDCGLDGHANAQQMIGILARIKQNLHRNALHNFDVISGGIFRRQQA